MRRKSLVFICLVIILSMLSGCSSSSSNKKSSKSDSKTKITKVTMPDADEVETSEVETVETVSESSEETAVVLPAETETIINNNGYFVQIGDKVYFHMTDADSLNVTALWGRYSQNSGPLTILCELDTNNLNIDCLSYNFTSGPISVQNDTLFSTYYTYSVDAPYSLMPETAGYSIELGDMALVKTIAEDTLIGASSDNSYVATYSKNYDEHTTTSLYVYRDGNLDFEYLFDSNCEFIKLGENEIFCISGDYGEEYYLCQINIVTGDIVILGEIPIFADDTNWGETDECQIDGNKIYLAYSEYQGTGHIFTQGYFIEAQIGVPDSLVCSDMPANLTVEEQFTPFVVIDGQMVACEGVPGTCKVRYDDGVLGYFDANGSFVGVAEDWGTVYLNDNGDYEGIELAELVGDYIYFIYNTNIHAPGDDIGWRYAYYRDYSDIYRVSIVTGEAELLAHQIAPWAD